MIRIRKATQRDTEKIASLWCELIDLHESFDNYYKRAKNGATVFREFVEKQISDRNALVLIAQMNKEVCAYLLAKIENKPPVFLETKYGMIFDIAVTKKYRRNGIGEKLYNEALEWFQKKKVKRIELTVATSNPISMRFWNKFGFKPYSERRYIKIGT